ncbi:facilitated trehalose transporter Tret1 isoform X3 [Halyomorpha halys]|uniref:facilitated trehalose transporter Tret1 isoform X3 n=1 Tax=Halyomorpha halys TaxID=286706 RepID=UPI0006D4CE2B|nr:facilitated trehalose transporter Tret1-like isoform X3 [Halyomorpha halys]
MKIHQLIKKLSKMDGEESHVPMVGSNHQPSGESSKLPQYLYTLAVTIGVFCGGAVIGWSSPALPELQSPNSTLPLTPDQGSWVGSLLAIGSFIGALPAGSVADLLGRKLTIMSLSVPLLISWSMIHFATSVNILYLARLLGGIGLGAICTTVPMYVSEIAEDSIRGALGSAFQLMLGSGLVYAYALGAVVHYTMLPLLCGVINILFLTVFFRAPESPMWLLKKDQRKRAEESLQRLRGEKYNIYRELHAMEKEIANQNTQKVPFLKAINKRSSILAMVICLGMMFFQQMSGINIVIFFAGNIFKDAGSSMDSAVAAILVGLAGVIATLVAASLIDRLGRKILLQISATAMALCLVVLGYYFHLKTSGSDVSSIGTVPLVSVIVYILMFGIAFGPIPWMISGEVLPPEIKATGTSIAVATNWFIAFTVTKSFQPLLDAVGPAVTYWIFACLNVLSFFFVTFVVIETKGKSLAQVQEELSGKRTKVGKTNGVV